MAYDSTFPADDEYLSEFPAKQREQIRAVIEDQLVNALKLCGLSPGNASGNIPQSNGTRCVNLNADKLDGHDSTYFSVDGHTHDAATTSSNGFMSNTDKTKLDGIATGAEVNQNTFANVKVGSTTVQADAKQDTLTLAAGSNITLTPDATNDKVTIAVSGLGGAAFTETSAYAAASHTHSYLPTSGGTLTGAVTVSAATPGTTYKSSALTRGTAPSSTTAKWICQLQDSAGKSMGGLYHNVTTGNVTETRLYDYPHHSNSASGHYIAIGHDADGNAVSYAPTPAATDKSTKIATTAFCRNMVSYASCSTAAGTAAKTATITGFALVTGARVTIKFTNTNTAASPTLNISSTGAKAIYYNGAAIDKRLLVASHTYDLVYNGTQWDVVNDVLVGSDNHIITPGGEIWIA